MTVKEAAKDIVDYFNLDLTDHGKIHLENILSNIYMTLVYKPKTPVDLSSAAFANHDTAIPTKPQLDDELKKICKIYGADFKNCFIKCRRLEVVQARVHFSRVIKFRHPSTTCVSLAEYFNVVHTTIVNYWHASKSPVDIPKIPFSKQFNR